MKYKAILVRAKNMHKMQRNKKHEKKQCKSLWQYFLFRKGGGYVRLGVLFYKIGQNQKIGGAKLGCFITKLVPPSLLLVLNKDKVHFTDQ